ncbi:hypothetical protein K501DRAFT_298726 [Backusella circina FSU 941]|nr:hypothetical protein K501DRAFT_298726 [Backusella circina FSU 941]
MVAQYKTFTVEYKDIYKIHPEAWLHDQIINYYMELLNDKASDNMNLPKFHCFNFFFFPSINKELKCMTLILKRIAVYDSLGGSHPKILQKLWTYLDIEHCDKKRSIPRDISGQMNNSDCGGGDFDFAQQHMSLLHQHMVL